MFDMIKKILIKVPCPAMGDTLCSTPTIKKLSECYEQKVDIMAVREDVLTGNPYVNKFLPYQDEVEGYDEIFNLYVRSIKTNKNFDPNSFYDTPMAIKLVNFEARQIHALSAGITLYPNELSCEFYPDAPTKRSSLINKEFLVFHVTESWPNKTWEIKKWQRLVDLIKSHTNYKIVTIGKSHSEQGYNEVISKKIIKLKNIDYDFCIDGEITDQSSQNGRESLSEMWHIINNAYGLVSFDSGPIHLAGTTDNWIFQIGGSVRPEKTAPWRNETQDYKFKFIGGECKLFCGTDPKYSVKNWGTINSMPYGADCQEGYKEIKCKPSPDEVFHYIKKHKNG